MFGVTAAGVAAAKVERKPLPDPKLRETDPEKYWLRIRKEQFLLPEWRAFLNNGSLGVAPIPVLAAMEEFLEQGAALTSDEYPRWGYETLDAERAEMAEFLGCKKDELALTHCATEGISTVAMGLDLKPGDEVVMTDKEHVSGQSPWRLREKRHGITVREVKTPHPPKSSAELAEVMINAIGPKTRVLSFSGIISPTGTIMPVKEICDAARAKGVLTLIDGAHMNGQIPLKLSDLGCDFYAGSPHKWMFAPAGCGILYIREENLDRLWPSIVTGGWDDKTIGAARFMKLGTNNRATVVGMLAGLRFLKSLGPENIYTRLHDMAKRNYAMAARRPHLQLLSSPDDRLYGALVTIGFKGANVENLWKIARERKIWVYGGAELRLSTHIHTRMADLEAFYSLVDEVMLGKKS